MSKPLVLVMLKLPAAILALVVTFVMTVTLLLIGLVIMGILVAMPIVMVMANK
jgi:hypothetical protein